ncbi:MAG: hypothetical protein J0I12_34545 [Candidatus Eremiobacteraeota bacterium]|nr:hypothetical protein [Candidatus Eremiobacteraeota bacterium]
MEFARRTVRKDGYVYLVLGFSQPVAVTELRCNGERVRPDPFRTTVLPRTPDQLLYALATNFKQARSNIIVVDASPPLHEAWLPLGPRGGRFQLGCTLHLAQGTGPEHLGDVVVRLGTREPEPELYQPPELVQHSLEMVHIVSEVRGPEKSQLLVNSAHPYFPLAACGTSQLEWTLGDEFEGVLATPGEGWALHRLALPAAHGQLPLVLQAGGHQVGSWVLDFEAVAVIQWVSPGRHLALAFQPEDGSPIRGLQVQPEAQEVEPGVYELPLDSAVPPSFSGTAGQARLSRLPAPQLHEFENAFLSFDRGVYLPGEEVVCFGWYRTLDCAQRQLRFSQHAPIRLKAPGMDQEVRLSALGMFCAHWRLPEELPESKVEVEIHRLGVVHKLPMRVLRQPDGPVKVQLSTDPRWARVNVTGPNVASLEWVVATHSSHPPEWSHFQFGSDLEKSHSQFAQLKWGRAELDLSTFPLEHQWSTGFVKAYVQHRTGRASACSHPISWPATAPVVGIRMLRPWTHSQHPALVEWVVCDSDGQLCAGQRVEFRWDQGDCFAAVDSLSVPGQLEIRPPAPGAVLQVRAGESQAELTIPLCQSLELHCDRKMYRPGDRISLTVSAPFEEAEGVLVCYWGLRAEIQRFRLCRGHAQLFLTAEDGMAPNFLAWVEILGRQRSLVVTRSIAVSADAWRLDVRLNLLGQARGECDLPLEVRVYDRSGSPCPEAEVLLLLLDREAVERNDHRFEDPLVHLFERPPESLAREDNLDRFIPYEVSLEGEPAIPPIGCSEGWGPFLDSEQSHAHASPPATVACLQLLCDADGVARGTLPLPAALLEYRLTAFALSGPDCFGIAEVSLKPAAVTEIRQK